MIHFNKFTGHIDIFDNVYVLGVDDDNYQRIEYDYQLILENMNLIDTSYDEFYDMQFEEYMYGDETTYFSHKQRVIVVKQDKRIVRIWYYPNGYQNEFHCIAEADFKFPI